ncbi:hypothetical protein D3C80_619240 [compost metagenome]
MIDIAVGIAAAEGNRDAGGVLTAGARSRSGFRGIVDRRNGDGASGWGVVFKALVIHRGVFEAGGAIPVGIGHEGDGRAITAGRDAVADVQGHAIQHQRAVGRQGLDDEAGDAAVDIAAAEGDRNAGRVLIAGVRSVSGFWRIVYRRYIGEAQLASVGQVAVADGVGRARHQAGVVRRRGKGVAAVGIDHQRADAIDHGSLARLVGAATNAELGDAEAIAVGIGVVAQHVAAGRGVFGDGDRAVIACERRVIHRADISKAELGGIGEAAIAEGIGRARHRPGVVRRRGEGVAAVGVDDQGTDTRDHRCVASRVGDATEGEFGNRQRVAVRIGIVAQDVAGGGGVLRHCDRAVIDGDRRIVDRINSDGAGGRGAVFQALVIHRCVLEAGGAVPVGVGHEGDGCAIAARRHAVADIQGHAVEQQGAVGWQGLDDEAGDAAVDITATEGHGNAGGILVA